MILPPSPKGVNLLNVNKLIPFRGMVAKRPGGASALRTLWLNKRVVKPIN
jgi:hypothetical protein